MYQGRRGPRSRSPCWKTWFFSRLFFFNYFDIWPRGQWSHASRPKVIWVKVKLVQAIFRFPQYPFFFFSMLRSEKLFPQAWLTRLRHALLHHPSKVIVQYLLARKYDSLDHVIVHNPALPLYYKYTDMFHKRCTSMYMATIGGANNFCLQKSSVQIGRIGIF